MNLIRKNIVNNLKAYFEKAGFSKAVVGLSGGIDSAVTFVLAVETLGKENVTALILPEKSLSKQENTNHARNLAQKMGVRYEVMDINSFLKVFKELPWVQKQMAKMNLKARIRMILLYNFANSNKALVLGTSNKSEIMIGYGTKFGDLAADIEVIGNLYKTDVYALARELGLSDHFLKTPPSAELEHDQTDEAELGITYEKLDKILLQIENDSADKSDSVVQMILEKIRMNKHKTKVPPVIKIKI